MGFIYPTRLTHPLTLTFIAFLCCIMAVTDCQFVELPGYTHWTAPVTNRSDLYCPLTCLSAYPADDKYTRCCACAARPCWDVNATLCGLTTADLQLEYINVFGEAMIVGDVAGDRSVVHKLDHKSELLTSLPGNLCVFNSSLVYVDLSHNRLTDVNDVKCLLALNTLILDYNMIDSMSNTTFSGMTLLQVLSLAFNQLKVLMPNTLVVPGSHIHNVTLTGNTLNVIDMTNVMIEGAFCEKRFDQTDLGNITNELGLTISDPSRFGPGHFNMSSTNVREFPDFTKIGILDYTELGRFRGGVYFIDDSSVFCDCNVYHLFEGLNEEVTTFWPNIEGEEGFVCSGPEHMKGKLLLDYYRSDDHGLLTCDLQEDCEDGCSCVYHPAENVVKVDCTYRNLDYLPANLPVSKFGETDYILLLNGNSISSVESRPYISNLRELVLVNNTITSLQSESVLNLKGTKLDMRHQRLSLLPREIQSLDPRDIVFGEHPVTCGCENSWIGEWIRVYNHTGHLLCNVDGAVIPAELVSDESLRCRAEDTQLLRNVAAPLAAFVTLVVALGLVKYFWFELFLMKRRLLHATPIRNPVVFISMSSNNDAVFGYVSKVVKPTLESNAIEFRIPWFQVQLGELVSKHTSRATTECDVFVVFLCENYLEDTQSLGELDLIWKEFKAHPRKSIIVVNWEGTSMSEIREGRVKALCRTGFALDFCETESKLIHRLMKRLCPRGFALNNNFDGFGLQIVQNKFMDDVEDNVRSTRFQPGRATMRRLPNTIYP